MARMGKGHGRLKTHDSTVRKGYHSHWGYKMHPKTRDHSDLVKKTPK